MPRGSMYTDLMEAALAAATSEGPASCDRAVDEVVRCRILLDAKGWPEAGRPGVWPAFAAEMAYDVALVQLARAVEVDCDTRNFGWPGDERQRVESALVSGGVLPA